MQYLFYTLFALVPIVLWPKTSEVFEFNKIVVVYLITILVSASWLIKCILEKKIIFRRTILDIPLLVFIASQVLSTFASIDVRTSIFGYYSRFNGGLLSIISYSLLYWAFVSNMDKSKTLKSLYVFLGTASLVSLYAVLEHFGIDKNIWVQDVQTRVFSTLGQPNWLASWVVAIIPIVWFFILQEKIDIKNRNLWIYSFLSVLFFLTLLYTKSRSGILGFVVADLLFWVIVLFKNFKLNIKKFLLVNLLFLVLAMAVGTPWTQISNTQPAVGPSLETGGTESGTIRKIVWSGALEIWKHYPLIGTGPETFAFSYYLYRPVEHNLVSEWDFLYNKAHNEYLNFAANTGTLGLLAYSSLIAFTCYLFLKEKNTFSLALLSGYSSILVSNFFGFSVVPIQIEFFLFPAIAISFAKEANDKEIKLDKIKTDNSQKIGIGTVIALSCYIVFLITRYWYADTLYARGSLLNDSGKYADSQAVLVSAVNLSPNEAIFRDELSQSYTGIALSLDASKQKDKVPQFIEAAIAESDKATSLSPSNLNIKRDRASMFIRLAIIDPKYLTDANSVLKDAVVLAPTDAKLFYNLGLTYARIGEFDKAKETLEKTVDMKANYRDARFALALVLIEKKDIQEARTQLKYILENISPNDSAVKSQLDEIGK